MWGRQYAGIGRYTQEIVSYLLIHRDWSFTLLVNDNSYSELQEYVNVNSLNNVEFKHSTAGLFSIKAQYEFVKNVPSCDVLWIPSINVPVFPTKAKKMVTTIHDVFHLAHPEYYSKIKLTILKGLIGKAVRGSNLIMTVSDFSADEIVRFYGKGVRSKIVRVYNGYNDVSYEKENVFGEDFKYFLFVGSIKPHKNLRNALLAYEKYVKENNNLRFVIVGKKEGFVTGDNDLHEIVNRINRNNENVIFTGSVNDNALYSLYASATSFIMPSYYEGFGIPLIEAMYFKLPIICSDIPVFHELCGEQVLYFDPYDVDSICERIKDTSNLKHRDYAPWLKWSDVGEQIAEIIEKQF